MARFSAEAYEKLYPRNENPKKETVESAVENFTPTQEIIDDETVESEDVDGNGNE